MGHIVSVAKSNKKKKVTFWLGSLKRKDHSVKLDIDCTSTGFCLNMIYKCGLHSPGPELIRFDKLL